MSWKLPDIIYRTYNMNTIRPVHEQINSQAGSVWNEWCALTCIAAPRTLFLHTGNSSALCPDHGRKQQHGGKHLLRLISKVQTQVPMAQSRTRPKALNGQSIETSHLTALGGVWVANNHCALAKGKPWVAGAIHAHGRTRGLVKETLHRWNNKAGPFCTILLFVQCSMENKTDCTFQSRLHKGLCDQAKTRTCAWGLFEYMWRTCLRIKQFT